MSWVKGWRGTTGVHAALHSMGHERTSGSPLPAQGREWGGGLNTPTTSSPGDTPSRTCSMTPFPQSAGWSKGLSCKDQEEVWGQRPWASPWKRPERQAASARFHLPLLGALLSRGGDTPEVSGGRARWQACGGTTWGADPQVPGPLMGGWATETQPNCAWVSTPWDCETALGRFVLERVSPGEVAPGSAACSPSGMLC